MTDVRISQSDAEVLIEPTAGKAQISQSPTEVLIERIPIPFGRVSQSPDEILIGDITGNGRVSQVVLEVLMPTYEGEPPPPEHEPSTVISTLRWCSISGSTKALYAGGDSSIKVQACQFDPTLIEGTIVYEKGDRAVWDAAGSVSDHANDIDDAAGIHHTLGSGAGQAAAGDHTHAPGAQTIETIFTVEGDLSVISNPLRIYNKYGATRTISQVFLVADTAPTGAAIIVDVHKNGTTIFTTQSNRPQIAAGANTGYSTTIEVSSWADGEYLQMAIDQVGSTSPGSNLTVHIIHL